MNVNHNCEVENSQHSSMSLILHVTSSCNTRYFASLLWHSNDQLTCTCICFFFLQKTQLVQRSLFASIQRGIVPGLQPPGATGPPQGTAPPPVSMAMPLSAPLDQNMKTGTCTV